MRLLGVLILVAVAAICLDVAVATKLRLRERNAARADEKDSTSAGYGVLSPAGHEFISCRAWLKALEEEAKGPIKTCPLFLNLRDAIPPSLPCQVFTIFGAAGPTLAAGWREMVDDASAFEDAAKQWASGVWTKAKEAVADAVKKVEDVGKAVGQDAKAVMDKTKNVVGNAIKSILLEVDARKASPYDIFDGILKGSREPDLPCADRDLGDNCVIDLGVGAANAKFVEKKLTSEHKPAEVVETLAKNAELKGFSPAARGSHFGALSIGHSQTAWRPNDPLGVPGVVEALQDPSIFKKVYDFKYSRAPIPNPTQQDVANAIVDLLLHFMSVAIAKGATNEAEFVRHMSRAAHTIGDSFSCSHTIRNADNLDLWFFQDYGAQNGDLHTKSGDALTGSKSPFVPRGSITLNGYNMAQEHASIVFRAAMRQMCTSTVPYAPVTASGKAYANAAEEVQHYATQTIYKFENAFFSSFPAKGCVTSTSMSADAAKNGRICSIADIVKATNNPNFKVCPDQPVGAAVAFAVQNDGAPATPAKQATPAPTAKPVAKK